MGVYCNCVDLHCEGIKIKRSTLIGFLEGGVRVDGLIKGFLKMALKLPM